MGRPPALIFVTRHGARLDAADPHWHLTSPAPYDPPLTYGGWRQTHALGARIAALVDAHDPGHAAISPTGRRGKRRRVRVVVHSSPFLRCVQTGIGIAAGIEHWRGRLDASPTYRVRGLDLQSSPRLNAIREPARRGSNAASDQGDELAPETLLRIDAFLGEWLSPDYFENITPPPTSKLMVAGAKASLLQAAEPIDPVHTLHGSPKLPLSAMSSLRIASDQGPGGIRNAIEEQTPSDAARETLTSSQTNGLASSCSHVDSMEHSQTNSPVDDMSQMVQDSTPKLSRSHTSHVRPMRYVPPVPTYATSASQPIPPGYVAHARDACVCADYAWDSLRPPHVWGDGGDFGEEWGAMHRRFRTGLGHVIDWYRSHAPALEEEPEEDETETVLVLVTHGAGCNALLGALTNQPVLIDVGMASLTMARRKDVGYTRIPTVDQTAPSLTSAGQEYDIVFAASTDHLRPHVSPERSPYRYERHVQSPPMLLSPRAHHSSPIRKPLMLSTESRGDFSEALSPPSKTALTIAATTGGGLWAPSRKTTPALASVEEVPSPLKLSHDESRPNSSDSRQERGDSDGSVGQSLARQGLWGAEPRALATERDRITPKRRWTLTPAA